MQYLFIDRNDAGEQLALRLKKYAGADDVVVLALPRGGVPVAYPIAKALSSPLEVFLVRKLGTPGQPELAMGAIASNDVVVMNDDIVRQLKISQYEIDKVIAEEKQVLERRQQNYIGDRIPVDVNNKRVILVDDGIATGATLRVAIKALRQLHCAKICVAVPVAPIDTIQKLQTDVDELVCLHTPEPFFAIGGWYQYFEQTTDQEVTNLLQMANNNW